MKYRIRKVYQTHVHTPNSITQQQKKSKMCSIYYMRAMRKNKKSVRHLMLNMIFCLEKIRLHIEQTKMARMHG